ncbi:hypothetical protein ACRXCV_11800 [Halobacteriovorax sp. GFR7]|uniref:hypothetical protein n=1 Tax=unclassified Halobacteriovorax TaxID=2639665 RepID=UPI003722DB2B
MTLKNKKTILRNESGIAIIMVTTAVAILTVLLAQFTYETKLNKIRIQGQVDKVQAKLNAEAGLHYALSVLKVYREAWNKLEDNTSLQSTISKSDIEAIATQPFIVPIPVSTELNALQKNAIAEFEKESLIQGSISVSLKPITGFLNPNTLRVIKPVNESSSQSSSSESGQDGSTITPHQFMEKTFTDMLERTFRNEIENNEDFALHYSNLDPKLLVKELKYYVSGKEDYDEPEKADIERTYQNLGVEAKHAAFETADELYSLAGWDDEIVNLIKDRISIHNVSVINVNEITINQLKVLFPEMSDVALEEFFKYRDGDEENGTSPSSFKSDKDFKELITNRIGAVEPSDFDKRIKEFADADIIIGTGGKLFKLESIGSYADTIYKLTAFIDLPIKPQAPSTTSQGQSGQQAGGSQNPDDDDDGGNGQQQSGSASQGQKSTGKSYLLRPRVVEIRTY